MNRKTSLLALLALALAACDREESSVESSAKSEGVAPSTATRSPRSDSSTETLRHLASLPRERQVPTLSERIYDLSDRELGPVVESILTRKDPDLKQALLTTLYEETQLRPAITRLPLLLEISRQPALSPDLRTTIMAELGETLNAEHGTSWADWALALDEHLAETEGLIRVE